MIDEWPIEPTIGHDCDRIFDTTYETPMDCPCPDRHRPTTTRREHKQVVTSVYSNLSLSVVSTPLFKRGGGRESLIEEWTVIREAALAGL
jgi:hypothetical protein